MCIDNIEASWCFYELAKKNNLIEKKVQESMWDKAHLKQEPYIEYIESVEQLVFEWVEVKELGLYVKVILCIVVFVSGMLLSKS